MKIAIRHLAALSVMVLASVCANAQDMFPIGKSWKRVLGGSTPDFVISGVEHYTVVGDTIVEGRTCRKAIMGMTYDVDEPTPKQDRISIFYEQDKIVYEYNPRGFDDEVEAALGSKFVPMMDFNLNEGDRVTIENIEDPKFQNYVLKVDSVMVLGEKRKRMFVGSQSDTDLRNSTVWVESVGSNVDHYGMHVPLSGNYFNVSFSMDGVEYFTYDDFFAGVISALETVDAPIETDDAIYNIKGQIIATPRKGEIVIKNGKKQIIN